MGRVWHLRVMPFWIPWENAKSSKHSDVLLLPSPPCSLPRIGRRCKSAKDTRQQQLDKNQIFKISSLSENRVNKVSKVAVVHDASSHHGQGRRQEVGRVASWVDQLSIRLAVARKEGAEAKGEQQVSKSGPAVPWIKQSLPAAVLIIVIYRQG